MSQISMPHEHHNHTARNIIVAVVAIVVFMTAGAIIYSMGAHSSDATGGVKAINNALANTERQLNGNSPGNESKAAVAPPVEVTTTTTVPPLDYSVPCPAKVTLGPGNSTLGSAVEALYNIRVLGIKSHNASCLAEVYDGPNRENLIREDLALDPNGTYTIYYNRTSEILQPDSPINGGDGSLEVVENGASSLWPQSLHYNMCVNTEFLYYVNRPTSTYSGCS